MKKIWKWTLRSVGALVVLGAGAGLYYKDNIVRLLNVNSLFEEENIVRNFSHMKDVFYFSPVPNKSVAPAEGEWPEAMAQMPETYAFKGKSGVITKRLEEFKTTSILVLHKGEVKHEGYFLGTEKDDRRISWSMAKSVLSAMFGIAISEGRSPALRIRWINMCPHWKKAPTRGFPYAMC